MTPALTSPTRAFKANAFRYSLQRNAENAGVDYDTYVAQLDLLTKKRFKVFWIS
ncbi:MAG: hypothetical protein ACLSHU_13350 [Oscillospiraceae bacterium]